MLTYIQLPQLPHPPKKFIEKARKLTQELSDGTCTQDRINKPLFNSGYTERTYIRHGEKINTRLGRMYSLEEEFLTWVKDYIHPWPDETGLNSLWPYDCPTMGPHIDTKRKYLLSYYIELGGSNVRTVWYKEKGQTVDRTHSLGPSGVGYWVENYKDLEEIDSVNMQTGIWYLMNPKIIHSVENIESNRTFIAVSLPDMDQFPWKNRVPAE